MTIVTTGKPKPRQAQPHRWSRHEFAKMTEIGLFAPDMRLELVEGEILEMAAHTSHHATGIALAQRLLDPVCGPGYHLRVQLPLALSDDSEPEPDLAIVAGGPEEYWERHPGTALLIVEVAYSSLEHDQERKRRLYARCQIPEYRILNLGERQLEIYREPRESDYQTRLILTSGDTVAVLGFPDSMIAVGRLLPPK